MKIQLTIPTSLQDITLKDFQMFTDISDNNEDTEFVNLKMIEIFGGVRLKELRQMNVIDYKHITNSLNKVFAEKGIFKQRIKIGSTEYGFIPALDDMTTGEYIDLNTYMANISDWHKMMAVLYRPIIYEKKGKYLIETYETSDRYSDIMSYAKLSDVMGAHVFFYDLGKELLKHIAPYLMEQLTDSQQKLLLERSGDGIKAFTDLQEEMSLVLKRL